MLADSILAQKLRRCRAWARCSSAAARPAVRVEVNPTQLNNYGIGLEEVRTRSRQRERQPPKGAAADDRQRLGRSAPTTSSSRPTEYEPLIVAYQQRRGGAAGGRRATCIDSVEDMRNCRSRQRQARGSDHHLPPARREHYRDGRPRARERCRSWRPPFPPTIKLIVAMDRTHDHPRLGARRGAHAADLGRAGDPGGVSSSCATCGPRSSPAWPCRSRWSARSA